NSPATVPTTLDLNELQMLSGERLKKVARELDLHLSPMRSAHQQIVDVVRAALGRAAIVTAKGFLDLISESFGMLLYPALNFLHLPEDAFVPRAIIQQFQLRAGQELCGTLRLPRDREKGLVLDQVTTIEGQASEQWTAPTDFEKLTPQFPQGR